MIDNIISLLEFSKAEKIKGKYIDIALGKKKNPESIKKAYKKIKNFN